MIITGGCRCRAVRYKIEADRITARHCWCRDCQYIGAGSGTVNVFFPSEAVKVEGALSDYTNRAASGNLMHRQFCPTCGTPVFTQSDARRHMIGVRAGTLDDPEIGKPQITIWTSSAPSWAVFDANIQQDEKQSATAEGKQLRGLTSLEAASGALSCFRKVDSRLCGSLHRLECRNHVREICL